MLTVAVSDKALSSRSFKLHLCLALLKYIILKLVQALALTGEVILCLLTIGGPIVVLVIVLLLNCYLAIKPIIHSLFPGVTYKVAFAKARKDVCRMFLLHARMYHRYSVNGFEKIPEKGGAVLVYYHGAIPLDYIFLVSEILTNKNRMILSIVDKFMIWTPGFEMMSAGMGCFVGTRETCVEKLKMGHLIGIAPGGGLEAQCGPADTYEIMWKKRSGFASIALAANVPVIPIFTENIRETVCNLQTGRHWWQKIYEKTRIPMTPMYGGFPVQLTTHIGDPIHPKQGMSVEELRTAVLQSMQGLIDKHQTLPGDVFRAVCDRVESESDFFKRKFIYDVQDNSESEYESTDDDSEIGDIINFEETRDSDSNDDIGLALKIQTLESDLHILKHRKVSKKDCKDDEDASTLSSGFGSFCSSESEPITLYGGRQF